jgi:hypothetical protein
MPKRKGPKSVDLNKLLAPLQLRRLGKLTKGSSKRELGVEQRKRGSVSYKPPWSKPESLPTEE